MISDWFNQIIDQSDANYASDLNIWKSMSDYIIMFCDESISWFSKYQDCIMLSSTEVNYIALTHAGHEAAWIHNLMIFIDQLNMSLSIYICDDNMSSILLSENVKTHQCIKHIDVRYYWIWEWVIIDQFKIIHESGDWLLADEFTKSLERIKFINFDKELNLKSKSSWFFYLFIFLFCSTRLQKCESNCVHVIYYCMLAAFDYATVIQILDKCLLSSWHKHSKLLWHSIFLDILSWIFVCICYS